MVMLTGCYQRYQRQSSPKKRLQRARLQQRNKRKKQITNNYTSLFFRLPKDFATSKDLDAISKLNDALAKEDRMINSWVIETVINQPDAVRYAFKDLNNDGVDEMIVANQQTDGSYFVTGVYYLKGSKTDSTSWRFRRWTRGARNATTPLSGREKS